MNSAATQQPRVVAHDASVHRFHSGILLASTLGTQPGAHHAHTAQRNTWTYHLSQRLPRPAPSAAAHRPPQLLLPCLLQDLDVRTVRAVSCVVFQAAGQVLYWAMQALAAACGLAATRARYLFAHPGGRCGRAGSREGQKTACPRPLMVSVPLLQAIHELVAVVTSGL